MKVDQSPIINAPCGPIQGRLFDFENGHKALAFQGIPFGKAPTGELRFKKSQPLPKWTTTKNCSQFSTMFPCIPAMPTEQKMSEDSLWLNVFAPVQNEQKKLPVLFFVHGGGFVVDSSSSLGDQELSYLLCSKQIIVVTVEYRLGILGFLTLESERAKGNYGLWDMALALQWTVDNIEAFGGDSKSITVGGQSAGGVAADLLSLSPHTRDLFQQLLLMAGTSHYELLNMDPQLIHKIFAEYAEHLGAQVDPTKPIDEQVFEFYKKCDAEKLALGVRPIPEFEFWPDMRFILGPVFDGDFFPKPLDELREEAPKKAVANGLTEHEGLILTISKAFQPGLTWEQTVSQALHSIRPDLNTDLINSLCLQAIGEKFEKNSPKYARHCVQVISNMIFNSGSLATAQYHSQRGDPIYNFVFGYYKKGTLGGMDQFLSFEAATHCMELPYLFGANLFGPFKVEEQDKEIVERFTGYLCSFIRTGSPNNANFHEQWKPFESNKNSAYFFFGQNEFGTKSGFCEGADHWNQVFKENPRKFHL